MAVDVGSAVGYLDLDISGFLANLKTAQSEAAKTSENMVTQMGNKIKGVGDKLSSTGTKLTAAVTTPIAGLGTTIVKTSASFESAMSQVQATLGITSDATSELEGQTVNTMDALSELAQQLGRETKFSASEAAAAINNMAMAGYDVNEIYDSMPTVLSLASAGALDLDYATQLVANGLNVMGMEASDAGELADKLAVTASNAYGSVSDFGEGLLVAGAQAKLANVSLTDTMTALGILGDAGISASEGGTYLRNTLKNLYTPTDEAAKVLEELGIRTQEDDGTIRDFQTVLQELGVALDGLTEGERITAMSKIFDTRTISAANALIEQSGDRWDELSTSIDNAGGAADRMAETQLNNLQGQLTILKSALEGVAIQLGEILVPIIKDVVDWIQQLVQKFSELDPSTQEFIVKAALVAAAIGPILLVGGKLISGIGSLVGGIGKVVSHFTNLGSAASSVAGPAQAAAGGLGNMAQSALGLVAAGAGIALAAAGLALLAQSAIALGEAGAPAIAIMGGLVLAIAGLAAGAAAVGPALTAGAVGLVAFGAAVTLIGTGILAATSGIALLATQLPTISEYGGSSAAAILEMSGAMAACALSCAGLDVAAAAALITLGLLTLEFAAADVACGLLAAEMAIVASSVQTIESSAAGAAESLDDMVTSVDIVKTGLEGLDTLIGNVVDGIVELFTSAGPTASDAAFELANGITENVESGLDPMPQITQDTLAEVNAAITQGLMKADETIKKSIEDDSAAITAGMNKDKEVINTGMTSIVTIISTNLGTITSNVRSVVSSSYGWGADFVSNFASGIRSRMSSLLSEVQAMAAQIRSYLHFSEPDVGPLSDFHTWMPDFMKGMADGIRNNAYRVRNAIDDVAADMKIEPNEVVSELFTKDDIQDVKDYNIVLIDTLGIYRQLVEQMKMYSEYANVTAPVENGLFKAPQRNEDEELDSRNDRDDGKDRNNGKPDQLVIPITIGDEQIENVVVDLLRREVRT